MDLSNSHSQVLQKLGKTVETKDERFEQSANNFYHQQVIRRVGKGGLEEARRQGGLSGRRRAGPANQQASLLSHPPPRGKGHRVICCLPFPWQPEKLPFPVPAALGFGGQTSTLLFSSWLPRLWWHHQVLRQSCSKPPPPLLLAYHFPRVPLSHPLALLIRVAPCFPCCLFVHSLCLT